jgi:hypothetical protein
MGLYAADALHGPGDGGGGQRAARHTAEAVHEGATALGDFLAGFLQMADVGSEYLPASPGGSPTSPNSSGSGRRPRTGASRSGTGSRAPTEAFSALWEIATNVFDVLTGIFSGLAGQGGGGADFLQMVADMTQSLADFVNSDGVQGILGFLGELARMIFDNIGVVLALWAGFQLLSGIHPRRSRARGAGRSTPDEAGQGAGVAWAIAVQGLLNLVMSMNPDGPAVIVHRCAGRRHHLRVEQLGDFRNAVIAVWEGIKAAFAYGVGFAKGLLEQLVDAWHGWLTGSAGLPGGSGTGSAGMWEPMRRRPPGDQRGDRDAQRPDPRHQLRHLAG